MSQEEIARCAYLIWEAEGRQTGREMDYWLQAEAQLHAMRRQDVELPAEAQAPGLSEQMETPAKARAVNAKPPNISVKTKPSKARAPRAAARKPAKAATAG